MCYLLKFKCAVCFKIKYRIKNKLNINSSNKERNCENENYIFGTFIS